MSIAFKRTGLMGREPEGNEGKENVSRKSLSLGRTMAKLKCAIQIKEVVAWCNILQTAENPPEESGGGFDRACSESSTRSRRVCGSITISFCRI